MMENQYPSTSYMPLSQASSQPGSYPPFTGYSHPHQHQHQHQQPHHESSRDNPTLPPLHTQAANYGQLPSLYNGGGSSHPQTPTAAHTPTTSSMAPNGLNSFSHQSSPATSGSMLPPSSSYVHYSSSQATLPAASTATTSASSLAATPAQARLPDLRPLQPHSYNGPLSSLPSFGASGLVAPQPYMATHETEPTHVVGSQGRRGILPSAPGRAAPPPPGTTAAGTAKSMIPAKDADGKFPCPHCNKTYLHAKHLKRHLLRHTGDRPYMCHLCKDTFSRSDILKRHFQKCSIRRGNPTGANHLAHQRRNTNGSNRLSISTTEPIALAGLAEAAGAPYSNGTMINSPTVNGEHSSYASSVASMSNRSSRANSLIHPGALNGDSRNSITGTPGGFGANVNSYQMRPHSASNPMPPSYNFHMPNGSFYPSNVKSEEQQQPPSGYTHQPSTIQENPRQPNGVPDWSMFSQHNHDGFMTQSHQGQAQLPIKSEGVDGHNNETFFSGLYSQPSGFGEDSGAQHLSGFPNWNTDLMQSDPLQSKANALLTYVLSNRTSPSHDACDEMRRCLTVDNIKHFIEKFTSFQGHWPIIHMPTFDIATANHGLVLTIICIGAVYSEKRDLYQVRRMMELVKDAVKNASRVMNVVKGVISEGTQPLGSIDSDIEELQALYMLKTLFVWHGNQEQRANSRRNFDVVVECARRMGCTFPAPPGHAAYSILHQPGPIPQETLSTWDWSSWIAQEKRSRVVFTLFLLDAALVMYFNNEPQFDPLELRLPLPADDAAWEAKSAEECRNALGLNGPAQQVRNVTGSQRPRQPDMRSAMRSLLEPNYTFQTRSTNVYSKFILIHALQVQICKVQRANFLQNGFGSGLNAALNRPLTPLTQKDWLTPDSRSAASSGVATPTDASHSAQAHGVLKTIHLAMGKWKLMWDNDMAVQYPLHSIGQRRFGFSRDAIHFYYLGQSFLRSTKASEWSASPDLRFMQVMTLLKKIKGFVANENTQGGLDTGSVGDIDDTYGIGDLTLDMKLLFKPIGESDSPVSGVRTDMI